MEDNVMAREVKEIERVEVDKEFRVCPDCGYEHGFHVSLIPEDAGARLGIVLVCPSCGARYDIGRAL